MCTKMWTQMFIAILFLIVKKWKQLKCLSIGEWKKKKLHIQPVTTPQQETGINYLHVQQEGWTSKTLCKTKAGTRLHNIRFHLH